MRIFISYRRDDIDVVTLIRRDLVAEGHEVFQDTHELEYGDDFKTSTLEQLDRAQVVLFVIGPTWLRQVLDPTKPAPLHAPRSRIPVCALPRRGSASRAAVPFRAAVQLPALRFPSRWR